jgi:hypothetical protein
MGISFDCLAAGCDRAKRIATREAPIIGSKAAFGAGFQFKDLRYGQGRLNGLASALICPFLEMIEPAREI